MAGINKRLGKSHPLAGDWDESAVPFLEGEREEDPATPAPLFGGAFHIFAPSAC
jgi:hypothetical protein